MQDEPTLVHLDPTELLLHEEVEPARIESLMAALAAERRQRAPVLVTPTAHGMFLLDGAHRTTALVRLGVPRIAAVVVPPAAGLELTGWTHAVRDDAARARLAALDGAGSTGQGPAVATVRTPVGESTIHAAEGVPAALVAAYRDVAGAYQSGPYTRVTEPSDPACGETHVAWHVPDLATIVTVAATVGVLPAGVTRFRPAAVVAPIDVGFDELGAAPLVR